MTSVEIIQQLEKQGDAQTKKTLLRHGIVEPLFGVKVEELKKILKQTKENHDLALALYDSGIYDAMYLAGLVMEPAIMTREELQHWANQANCPSLRDYTVAWVAAESRYGMEMAREWIKSDDEAIVSIGWSTLQNIVSIKDDSELDIPLLKQLLDDVAQTIHTSSNNVKLNKNKFVIAVGSYIKELNEAAKQISLSYGKVIADMGDTACKIPSAIEYIEKAESKNAVGKKRKSARC